MARWSALPVRLQPRTVSHTADGPESGGGNLSYLVSQLLSLAVAPCGVRKTPSARCVGIGAGGMAPQSGRVPLHPLSQLGRRPPGPASLALELQGPASGSLNGPFVEAELARASRADPLLLATRYAVSHVSLYLQDRAAHVVARNADLCCGDRDDPERGCRSASGNDDVRLRGENPAERCAAGESGCLPSGRTRGSGPTAGDLEDTSVAVKCADQRAGH